MSNIFFNAHHAPIGGFGAELGKPADQNIDIGLETRGGGAYEALRFYAGADGDEEPRRYDVERIFAGASLPPMVAFPAEETQRDYHAAMDAWTAGDLTFTLSSPVRSMPDPATVSGEALKDAAHSAWLIDMRNEHWAWSDKMVCGEAIGSHYYPRGVTTILWCKEASGAK